MVYIPRRRKTKRLNTSVGEIVRMPAVASASAHTLSALSKILDNITDKMAPAILSFYQEEAKAKNQSSGLSFEAKVKENKAFHIKNGSTFQEYEESLNKLAEDIQGQEWAQANEGLYGKAALNTLAQEKINYAKTYFEKKLPEVQKTKLTNALNTYNNQQEETSFSLSPNKAIANDNDYRNKVKESLKESYKLMVGEEGFTQENFNKFLDKPENKAIIETAEKKIYDVNRTNIQSELRSMLDRGGVTHSDLDKFVESVIKASVKRAKQSKENTKGGSTSTKGPLQYLPKNVREGKLGFLFKLEMLKIEPKALASATTFTEKAAASKKVFDDNVLVTARNSFIKEIKKMSMDLTKADNDQEIQEIRNETVKTKNAQNNLDTQYNTIITGGSVTIDGEVLSGQEGFTKLTEFAHDNGLDAKVGAYGYHTQMKTKVKDKSRRFNMGTKIAAEYVANPENFPTEKLDLAVDLETKYRKEFPNATASDWQFVASSSINRIKNVSKNRSNKITNYQKSLKGVFNQLDIEFVQRASSESASSFSSSFGKEQGRVDLRFLKDSTDLDLLKNILLNKSHDLERKLTDPENPISNKAADDLIKEFKNTVNSEMISFIQTQLEPLQGDKITFNANALVYVGPTRDPLDIFFKSDPENFSQFGDTDFFPKLKNRLIGVYRNIKGKSALNFKKRIGLAIKMINVLDKSPKNLEDFRLGEIKKSKQNSGFAIKRVEE
tara:strand:+ start:7237 stop:9405 length:2169 start_codon:yes stop_codon:yes gene_type:complete